MKIGICSPPFGGQYEDALCAGSDYIEINNSSAFGWSEEEFLLAKENIKKNSLPVYSANCMFPGHFRLTGKDATSKEEREAFLEKSFSRISELGAVIAVLGSGRQRSVPEGENANEFREKLFEIVRSVGLIAAKYGLTVALEPLNRRETNVFNTLRETAEFVHKLNEKNVRLLADSYHMAAEREAYASAANYSDVLVHAHFAEAEFGTANIRRTPTASDCLGSSEFVRALKECGYSGNISLECSLRTGDRRIDYIKAVEALREWSR